jgi:L-histidine Nalpha-methyltransferase
MTRARAPRGAAASPPAAAAQFAADVQYYLVQEPRQLPSRYLYDELGSALFDAICRLPWYPITAAEMRLLSAHGAEVLRRTRPSIVVELGSGSGAKLRTLLEGGDRAHRPCHVHLIDLSEAALAQAERTLASLEPLEVTGHLATYESGMEAAARAASPDDRVLTLFLGSNLGNFDPPSCEALLCGLRGRLGRGDALLLGADLVKPASVLRLAYDDPLGVTAAFNRNLLLRVNRELGGDFDIDRFVHRAVWNGEESRIEMHLVSLGIQDVRIAAVDLAFRMADGEPIWTESSYKYRPDEIGRLLSAGGFRVAAQWIDETAQFALTLAEAD